MMGRSGDSLIEHKPLTGSAEATGGTKPGVFATTGNAARLVASSGVNLNGEASGSRGLEGRAEAAAQQIAQVLDQRFKNQGCGSP